jgi:hypothetical protein
MSNLKVTKVKDGSIDVLRIEIPLQPPRPSKSSGKSLIVASSGGIQTTDVIIDGKNVKIGLNCFIPI